jgi:hypothetical protein
MGHGQVTGHGGSGTWDMEEAGHGTWRQRDMGHGGSGTWDMVR